MESRVSGGEFALETGGRVVGHAVGAVFAPLGERELAEGVFADAVEVPAPKSAVIVISAEYGYGYAYRVEGGVEERVGSHAHAHTRTGYGSGCFFLCFFFLKGGCADFAGLRFRGFAGGGLAFPLSSAFCKKRNCPRLHSSLTIEWPRVRKEAFMSRTNLSMRLVYCRRVIPGSPPEIPLMKFTNASSVWHVSLIAAAHSGQGRLFSRNSRKLRHSAIEFYDI